MAATTKPSAPRTGRALDDDGEAEFGRRRALIELPFRAQGITFTVYGDAQGTERTFPRDPVPRVIPADEWARLEAGLRPRVRAPDLFLEDVHGDQQAIADDVIPRRPVTGNPAYREAVRGVRPRHGAFTQVVGCDLVRDDLNEAPRLEIVPTHLGSESSDEERARCLKRVEADPAAFVAQPIVQLSIHPTYAVDSGRFEPRHVDLRPYVLMGETITLVPGGLTRVALRRGSISISNDSIVWRSSSAGRSRTSLSESQAAAS